LVMVLRVLGLVSIFLLALSFGGFLSIGVFVESSGSLSSNQNPARFVLGFDDPAVIDAIRNYSGAQILKIIWDLMAAVIVVPDSVASALKHLKGVRYVEPDHQVKVFGFSGYSDVLWNVRIINANKVWDSFYPQYGWAALGFNITAGSGVSVAVLDTGIDYRHPDLFGRVVWCANTVGTSTYAGTDLRKCIDRNGHGTHVAGIIASAINNIGNAGVAPNVSLYAVKVLSNSGSGTYSDVAEGIVIAVKGPDGVNGTADDAMILSMSLGGSSPSHIIEDAIRYALENKAVIVAAAGNSGDCNPSTDNIAYPARYSSTYSNVIAVGAMDQDYRIPCWSSDGPELTIVAPGVNIYSTYKNNGYATLSGTSMATPHVSASIAIIQALRTASGKTPLDPGQVRSAIINTALDLGAPGFDVFSGYGLINTLAAVQYAISMP